VTLDENIDEIRVELKTSIKSRPLELDAVKIDPRRYNVVLENALVRVVRLRFEGREAGLMATHPAAGLGDSDERPGKAPVCRWAKR